MLSTACCLREHRVNSIIFNCNPCPKQHSFLTKTFKVLKYEWYWHAIIWEAHALICIKLIAILATKWQFQINYPLNGKRLRLKNSWVSPLSRWKQMVKTLQTYCNFELGKIRILEKSNPASNWRFYYEHFHWEAKVPSKSPLPFKPFQSELC